MQGVRNVQARTHLAAMRIGDQVLFYHSQQELAIVGLCEVAQPVYPDPTSSDARWLAADFRPIRTLAVSIPLFLIKKTPGLEQVGFVRQPRLSVMPISALEFQTILAIEKSNAIKM